MAPRKAKEKLSSKPNTLQSTNIPTTAALADLENQVAQFVQAMQDCNRNLVVIPPTSTTSGTVTVSGTADSVAQLMAAISQSDVERRRAFEAMRVQWMTWAEDVMSQIEAWLGRWDLRIAERMTVLGLADRMAWYGVQGKKDDER